MMRRARIRVECIGHHALGGGREREDIFVENGLRSCELARVKAETYEGQVRGREAGA